jgi:lipopolysaccharide assembly protein A
MTGRAGNDRQEQEHGTMSAERPAAEGPAAEGSEPAPAERSLPPEPEAAAPADAEPTLAEHTIEPTRTSMVWTMVGIGVVLLVAILVFILQNGQRVRMRFLMVDGTLPLGVALLFAALLGALLVLVAGAARVLQLRVVARRHRRTDQGP